MTKSPKEILKEKLEAEIKRRNWTGRELARQLKVSPPSALGYLEGMTLPGPEVRGRIADILGISPAELEAELFQLRLEQRPVESICSDIRAMDDEDFYQVYEVAQERALSTLKRAIAPNNRNK